ncbi:class I SAM-dependent methyltransferase [Denitromonas ohlonensis]|uniref:Class I SAM-dependent methyltransferase n=2 Tax=Denitromonas TaxID=139331 RepID=A0A557RKR2_9RHOO|nr:class I SAM-dependent methyltransferase [Denitromonas ohlonensis]TVO65757.1 class I SAM-dependent methyltransferase [Denitromonas ohlonensis]TVO79350.1 class I SAM-dependent methyltransferase [Denitromonas ohlonensis]
MSEPISQPGVAAIKHGGGQPSAWVQRHAGGLMAGSSVLDLACGRGRHARWLADRGCHVTAADRDPAALAAIDAHPGVTPCALDLESGDAWPWPDASFDAIVVTNYLHRPSFDRLAALLCPGGLLIYETFMLGNAAFGKPSNPNFLLMPGELLERTREAFTVLAFEQGEIARPAPAMVQRICARKGEAPGRLPE